MRLSPLPPDQAARDQTLDTTRSWIVQAPAGAGKTELLTSRFLALMAQVDEPEEILAITFTRAATAEMRERVLHWLRAAAADPLPKLGDRKALTLARAALAHARRRGWQILEQPHRLDIQTIDALAMRFAHAQPLLARLGGKLEPAEDAQPMYTQAAHRTLARLGDDTELSAALRHLLLLRDNNLGDAQKLIAGMLARRDQWAHVFPLASSANVDWAQVRDALERPFRHAIERTLRRVHALLAAEPLLVERLVALGRYACANQEDGALALLCDLQALPGADAHSLETWLCLATFLLTEKNAWRRSVTRANGFPVHGTPSEQRAKRERKQEMEEVLKHLQPLEALRETFCELRTLPAPRYDETQWHTLQAIFRILRHSAAELRVVFAERNQVDFTELGMVAQQVLSAGDGTPLDGQVALASDSKRHLLIDEFQDTSRRQHSFLSLLLREWQPGDGRTVFLVGDPMQSIYLFRQAEFELFHHVQQHGIPCGPHTHPCNPLHLKANFRSHSGLVDPLNGHFTRIFGSAAAVPFSRSIATSRAKAAVHIHTFFETSGEPESRDRARLDEACATIDIIRAHLPRAEAARLAGEPSYRIAVLVRARTHLPRILAELRAARIPYRAIDLEPLTGRQEILDLLSLTRALLVSTDRLSWLSVLRAPWCGLTLADLHLLTGADDRAFRFTPVPALIRTRTTLLSTDGRHRLERVYGILARAIAQRFRGGGSFSRWVEQTWRELGGPACVQANALENTRVFFRLLDQISPDGMGVLSGAFNSLLERLCAEPDVAASATHGVQVLTIHKSKGLGFEVVIVPGLERGTNVNESPLVTLLERANPANLLEEEVLMAPLGGRGEDSHRTYRWIERQRQQREDEERKRLIYVACTRAQKELHLSGTATVTSSGALFPGQPKRLLSSAWPALETSFKQARQAPDQGVFRFPDFRSPEPGVLDIAARAEDESGSPSIRRLPAEYAPTVGLENVTAARTYRGASAAFVRPEGSRAACAQGNAVHALFEVLAEAFAAHPAVNQAELLPRLRRRATQLLREAAFSGAELTRMAGEAVTAAVRSAEHPEGRWTLAHHPEAHTEAAWTQWHEGAARTVRADRTFLAGAQPLSSGNSHLWIVDYKTGPVYGDDLDAYLADQRKLYRPQLEAYGRAARAARGATAHTVELRYALYFAQAQRLTFWSGEEASS